MKGWPEERRRRILDLLGAGRVSVQELSGELGVSAVTIRRDLAALNADGRLLRVHGGAMPSARMTCELSFREKASQHTAEKEAIGRAAAALAPRDATVFFDTGTTTLAVARALRHAKPRTIITVNLFIAAELIGEADTRVLMPGGEVGRKSPDLLGEWALRTLSEVNVDIAFLGCDSVDIADGFYAVTPESAAVSRLMLS